MTDYVRHHNAILLERIAEPRHFIQVLAGPRQVGKTTLIRQVAQHLTIPYTDVSADGVAPDDTDWIRTVWESARGQMTANGQSEHLLIFDEIQKIENWSEVVKCEWDKDTRNRLNLKVVLLGSSRLMLRKGLTESLAGRFELIRMEHWTYSEMHEAFGFNLDQYIYYGGYPGAAEMVSNERRWKRYILDALVAPAIEKDAILTSSITKPQLMKNTFELGCAYSAELLSLTKMVGQLQDSGNVTTVASYIKILSQCHLLCGLQKYANDDARKYNSIPKFQVYNNALLTAYKGRSYKYDRSDAARWGRWVESAVGAYLMNQAEEVGYKVYYWRERSEEVDYVIQSDDITIAIEVKSGRRGPNGSLSKFNKLFNPTRTLIVGTDGIPLETFFSLDIEKLLY